MVGDARLEARTRVASLRLAEAVLRDGLDPRGGLYNGGTPDGVDDTDKEWWPQAEAVVGFVSAYQLTGREDFLRAAGSVWSFVERHFVDRERGEWRRRVAADGTPRPGCEKAGPWKCPYHNARASLELLARFGRPQPLATALPVDG